MPRWTDVSAEPNSREAKQFRLATLQAARQKPVQARIPYLQELTRDKRVLDVGVVAHAADYEKQEQWLHRAIASVASYCLGVDILAEDVKKLQAAGYNVQCCDITQNTLSEKFDTIVVGEVIEHLGSPERLFEACRRLLTPTGRTVMTTPNPYYWKQIRNNISRRHARCESVDHVALLFPSGMAELADRAGLRLDAYRGIYKFRSRASLPIKRFLGATVVRPELFCETLIYEFVPA